MNSPLHISAKAILASQAAHTTPLDALLTRVCLLVAPAFSLRDMVAVNPFLGYSSISLLEASQRIEALFHVDILPSPSSLRASLAAGDFEETDLLRALEEDEDSLSIEVRDVLSYIAHETPGAPPGPRFLALLDQATPGVGQEAVASLERMVARFLAARFDEAPSGFRPTLERYGLFEGFLRFAGRDRSADIAGLKGFRALARAQSPNALALLERVRTDLALDDDSAELYFGRLLGRLNGWASYLRHLAWKISQRDLGELPELLAILAFVDGAPRALLGLEMTPHLAPGDELAPTERALRAYVLRAKELAFARKVIERLALPKPEEIRPLAQAVFCIDVRSERLRRNFERCESSLETYGFAGFFGLAVAFSEHEGDSVPHCPPLLTPARTVPVRSGEPELVGLGTLGKVWKKSPFGALGFVESFGFGYALPLLRDAFAVSREENSDAVELDLKRWTLDERVQNAAAILKNLGLRGPQSRLVLLVGHDSHVSNNPQKAGLSCGACAGHGGDKNALLAAMLLNDGDVRRRLKLQEKGLPDDTVVVPLLHETVTDRVRVVPGFFVPPSHREQLAEVLQYFEDASAATRVERSLSVFGRTSASEEDFARLGRSVSEVRPEWALARNAGFIVGRRSRTREGFLGGRAFLHSYDEALDPDGSVLTLILTAPAVVGSWINLQYYASTVRPEVFGSGTKTLHNVVGGVGVVEGNEGDLAVGLSAQSVFDPNRRSHEPLRLQIFVEASEARIAEILDKHASIGDLVRGEWVHLYALSRDSLQVRRFDPRRNEFVGSEPMKEAAE